MKMSSTPNKYSDSHSALSNCIITSEYSLHPAASLINFGGECLRKICVHKQKIFRLVKPCVHLPSNNFHL